MNIVLFSNSFLPSVGGRELVVHYLAKSLNELGHDARVVVVGGRRLRENLKFPYSVHTYPGLSRSLNPKISSLWYYFDLKKYGVDIINAHATYPVGYNAVKIKNIFNVPVVITPHGFDIHANPAVGRGLILDPKLKDKIKLAVKNADLVTSISNSITDSLISANCPSNNIRYIPNGIDIERFTKKSNKKFDVKQWLKVSPESELLLTVGGYHPRKGLDVIVKSLPHILKENPNSRLVIVGRGSEALKPLINELNLMDKVILTGLIPFPNFTDGSENSVDYLAELYHASSLYICGSVDEGAEGLSLAVLDAMAAGLSIVATNISGNRDIITDGFNGFLVEPKNEHEIARVSNILLKDSVLSEKIAKEERRFAQNYSWHSIAKKYIAVYEEAVHSMIEYK